MANPNMSYLPLILLGVLLNAAAQLLLKAAMNGIGHFSFSWDNLVPVAQKLLLNPYFFGGLSAYAISIVVWLLALSRVDVSVAYPMLSLGYVVVAITSHFYLQEPLSFERILGIVVIMIGVFLLTRTT